MSSKDDPWGNSKILGKLVSEKEVCLVKIVVQFDVAEIAGCPLYAFSPSSLEIRPTVFSWALDPLAQRLCSVSWDISGIVTSNDGNCPIVCVHGFCI